VSKVDELIKGAAAGTMLGFGTWILYRFYRLLRANVTAEVPASDVEPYPTNAETSSGGACVKPEPRPGVEAFRDWVLRTYGGQKGDNKHDLGIWRACDTGGASEHKIGQAWDWGTTTKEPHGDALIAKLSANDWELGRRLGVAIVIWNRKIWTAWRRSEGWRAYTGADPHTTHVHFSFSRKGAMGETSGYALLRGGAV
jgi:hypothetical protein